LDGLDEFGLAGIAPLDALHEAVLVDMLGLTPAHGTFSIRSECAPGPESRRCGPYQFFRRRKPVWETERPCGTVYRIGTGSPAGQPVSPTRRRFISKIWTGGASPATRMPTSRRVPSPMVAV